jgi:hypothetical protein
MNEEEMERLSQEQIDEAARFAIIRRCKFYAYNNFNKIFEKKGEENGHPYYIAPFGSGSMKVYYSKSGHPGYTFKIMQNNYEYEYEHGLERGLDNPCLAFTCFLAELSYGPEKYFDKIWGICRSDDHENNESNEDFDGFDF